MDSDEFPRALCHEDELQEMIDKWEAKHSTPVSDIEMQEFMAAVHYDHEECECSCCLAA
jgi:hypothetical protein